MYTRCVKNIHPNAILYDDRLSQAGTGTEPKRTILEPEPLKFLEPDLKLYFKKIYKNRNFIYNAFLAVLQSSICNS